MRDRTEDGSKTSVDVISVKPMNPDIKAFNNDQAIVEERQICETLATTIRLMVWSGASFDEDKLNPGTGKFKDASVIYTDADKINLKDLKRWIKKSKTLQWDYKNVAKRKGKLVRIE